jgi:NitT/TauT family transport system substrate-binding protein
MNNGADILAAVMSGAIDVGLSNTMSLVLAFKKGAPLQLVAPSGLFSKSSAAIAIVVLKTATIASAKDLEGKVIGASPIKGFPQLATDAWIDKNGGDPAKVRYVEMPFSEMQPALVSGRIAAALMGEPFTSEAKGACRVLAIPYFALAPQLMTSAYCTSTAFATAHPDLIARFASAMRAAAIWANKNQVKTGTMLAGLTKLEPSVIAEMQRSLYAETLAPALIQPAIDLAYARKVIDAPFPASDMIFHPGK